MRSTIPVAAVFVSACAGPIRCALKVAAVALLASCGEGDPVGTANKGSIRGTVTDNTGATVASAAIELSGNAQAARTTYSGATGVYNFTDVPAGTYTLTVTAPAGFTIDAGSTVSVAVAGGTQATASEFVLNRVTVALGSVRGTITDDKGASVANATVGLTGNGQPARTAKTGSNGVYTFADVPTGTYTLTVTPPFGYTIGTASPPPVTVAAGAQSDISAFVLSRITQAGADSAFVAALRAHLEAATAAETFSGAVLVTRNGSTLFEGAYGLADRALGVANTPLTQFRVASMNKMMTAVAALQLVQEGKVRLDEPLGTYLPDYPNAEVASKVTLHHLLTHTGGTGDIFGPEYNAKRLELRTTSDYLALYGTRGLLFEPGTQYMYSNYGFILLGAVIERVSGTSYYDHLAARVLAPTGMLATGFAPEDSLVHGRAVGYMRLPSGALVSNAQTLPYRGTSAGGAYSTVGDFARFAAAIQERRLLDAAHTTLLLAGKVTTPGGSQYAYGFVDRFAGGRRFVGHSGGAAGMTGFLEFEPNGGYVIVVLSNFSAPAATQVTNFILSNLPATVAGGAGSR